MADKLHSGDSFPQLKLNIAGGDDLTLPDDFAVPLNVVLFYRGHW